LEEAEIFGDQLVRTEAIFPHLFFAVGPVLRQVSATDNATMISADPAANKIDTFYTAQFTAAAGICFPAVRPHY
jgi:hypothetical protein